MVALSPSLATAERPRLAGGSRDNSIREILGVAVAVRSRADAIEEIDAALESRRPLRLAFANANLLNLAYHDEALRSALSRCLVLNDGVGVDLAGRWLYGRSFRENLNGTDFVPAYLETARRSLRVFLLGAKPGVAERAATRLEARFPRHQFVGVQDGYFHPEDAAAVIEGIRASGADLVLVAMGNPIQELWLAQHLEATGCTLGFGVGALFDFVTGEAPRAPALVRKLRLEWVFRLLQEPRRLARRYLVGNPLFLARVLRQKTR